MLASTSRRLALAACALVLAGCAATGPVSTQAVAPYRDSIELNGRLSVTYKVDGKDESLSGKFAWVQVPGAVDVSLASPLGQTIATIKVTPSAATLTQSDKAPRSAPDINTLTAQALGWQLPVAGLRDWLQGYAIDAGGKKFVASPAANTVTTPDGWKLTYVSWHEGAVPAPKRIDAERPADELAIRIIVDARN